MSKYNSKCPLINCNQKGCGILLCQRYADYQQGRGDAFKEIAYSNSVIKEPFETLAYERGAKEFAEWLQENSYLNWVGEGNDINSISAKEVLAEWQKDKELLAEWQKGIEKL